ncbi:hypothetical protein EI534_30570 [Pseudomonas frederiksbergensis]|nr:hypothetical protein [Pseudomonas frederiksbergensis]
MSSTTAIYDISEFETQGDTEGWFATADEPVVEGGIYTTKIGNYADLRKRFNTSFKRSEIKIKLRMRIPQADVQLKEFTFSAMGTDGPDFIKLKFAVPNTGDWQDISGSWTPTTLAPLTEIWLRLVANPNVSGTAEFDYIEIEQA